MKKKSFWIAAAVFLATESMTVLAGGINAYESSVISVACGTFQYNGKTYVAKAAYQAQLQAKLAEDGIDLTQDQANEAISLIYANVETGVVQGYLEEVGGSSEETEKEKQESAEKKHKKEKSPAQEETQQGGNTSSKEESPQTQSAEAVREQSGMEQQEHGEPQSIGEAIETDEEASDYEGYDIKEIYGKDVQERTEEEQQVLDQYVAERAVDQLHLGEDELQAQARSKTAETGSPLTKKENRAIVLIFSGAVAVMAVALLIWKGLREKKALCLKRELPDIYTDIHTHILPGVDDGSPDMDTTIKMAELAYQQGIRYLIATPHYQTGKKHLKVEDLKKVYHQTQKALLKKYPDLHLLLGNELYYSESCIEKLEQGRALTLAESRYVLVEFSFDCSAKQITEAVISLLRERYIPVIAHAERYGNLMKDMERIRELRRMGAWIQVNASGGKAVVGLIRNGCVDLLATDCHDIGKRKTDLKKGLRRLCLYTDKETIERILIQNPQKIINTKEKREENRNGNESKANTARESR